MSREKGKAHEVPVPSTSTSILPTPPPRRFLGSSSYLSLPKKLIPSSSVPPSALNNLSTGLRQRQTAPQPATPPKLTRFPTIVLVDVAKLSGKEETKTSLISTISPALPPPPPLTKMPISTRKDRRLNKNPIITTTTKNDAELLEDTADRQQEPPRKRSRMAQKSGESTRSESTTPRKIIQEIFGPDKSKRPKGKGRKKRRGVTTPKKKILSTGEKEEEQKESEEKCSVVEMEDDDKGDVEESVEPAQHDDDPEKVETINEGEEEAENDHQKEEEGQTEENVDDSQDEVQKDQDGSKIENHGDKEMHDDDDETASMSSASVSRRVSRRQAKVVANERLKRLSQSEDGGGKEDTPTDPNQVDESQVVTKDEAVAAGVHSRRSTTDGSSKSGSSIAQPDSENSGGDGASCISNVNDLERQGYNPTTAYSNISEDDDEDDDLKDEEGADNGSVISGDDDNQEHKDSDVDSTYSWKPVRAAAAVALEQVTKNQGNGSTGLPGDAEAKAAAAAERRARKINRYKGRNRRTLLFKSSSSKKHTAARNSRYSAQPTIAPKVFHHGHYFQAGDIVTVEMADGTLVHGQIRGLMMDHFGEVSAGIRFLAPKHPVYAFMDYEPLNYAFRYDIPEKLIKIEFVNFLMHLSLDYFDGNPSYNKIEKKSLYTRMGKSLQKSYENNQAGLDNDSSSESSSSSSGSEHGKKKAKDEATLQGRRRHISDSSTDIEQTNEDEKLKETQNVEVIENQKKENDVENATDSVTTIEVDV